MSAYTRTEFIICIDVYIFHVFQHLYNKIYDGFTSTCFQLSERNNVQDEIK